MHTDKTATVLNTGETKMNEIQPLQELQNFLRRYVCKQIIQIPRTHTKMLKKEKFELCALRT